MLIPTTELNLLAHNSQRIATELLTKLKRERKYRPKSNFGVNEQRLIQAVVDLQQAGRRLAELAKEQ